MPRSIFPKNYPLGYPDSNLIILKEPCPECGCCIARTRSNENYVKGAVRHGLRKRCSFPVFTHCRNCDLFLFKETVRFEYGKS